MTPPKTFAGFSEEDARREAERQANSGNNQPPPNPQPQGKGTSYKGIEFEPQAQSMSPGKYDASLERLRKAGYERHARPQEAFGLLIDGLEGRLSNDTKSVYQDMIGSKKEWLSFAFERRGDVFIAYLDPEGIVFANRSYFRDGINFKYAEKKEFIIRATTKTYWPLLHVDDKFIEFVYGRHFQDLPEEIQKIMIRLPDEDTLSPVLRHDFGFGSPLLFGASRGVRKAGGAQ